MESVKADVENGGGGGGGGMESTSRTQDSLSLDSASSDGTALRARISVRQKLQEYMRSTPCQVLLVGLVIVDTLLVIIQLMLDLSITDHNSQLPFIFHVLSLTVLSIFVVEIMLKLYAYRLDFFTHKGDVFDAIVVIVSLSLDAAYLHSHDAHTGVGFLIVLRLWRVVHIQHAMVSHIKKAGDKKLVEERQNRDRLEQEVERYRTYSYAQDGYIKQLQELLNKNNISYKDTCKSPPDINKFMVVAEVTPQ